MERITQFRARMLLVIFGLILCLFVYRLYDQQIFETGGVIDNTTTYTTWTRVKAARGDILDRDGNVMVGNRASYDLTINHYVLTSADNPNQAIYQLVKLCQELGVTYNDHFPMTQERPFTYTLEQYNSAWQGYFQTFLYERGELDSDISAPLLIETLRKSYNIPNEWTDEEARLVLGIRYELTLRTCTNLANYVFISDADDADLSQILELNVPGLKVEASTVREYYTTHAAHILGYVGAMDAEQWEYYKTLGNYSMDAEIGQTGFEAAFEEYLHGTDGVRVDKMTIDGTIIESYYDPAPIAGNNVEVTIDMDLQVIAEEQLAVTMEALRNNEEEKTKGRDAEGASVVVMDVKTGQILACASYPTYNPITFRQDFNELKEDKLKPMYNRALSAAYPPGSTYKMSMVIAGIDSNTINSETDIEDKGFYEMTDGTVVSCLSWTSKKITHGHINAREALCVSCNYFFYDLGTRITLDAMDSTAKGLGLGEPTGIELTENIGHRANKETKLRLYGEDDNGWYLGDQIRASIGQSDNRFTPLQLCVYTTTLANKGTRLAATFLNRVVSTDYRSLVAENQPEILSQLNISDDAYLAYTQGMRMVASYNDETLKGTAYDIFRNYPIEVAAKTGTAQTGINSASDNGAFVCFAPFNDPQIAIAVYGEKAGSGSAMGAVAKKILDTYFEVGESADIEVFENQMS